MLRSRRVHQHPDECYDFDAEEETALNWASKLLFNQSFPDFWLGIHQPGHYKLRGNFSKIEIR